MMIFIITNLQKIEILWADSCVEIKNKEKKVFDSYQELLPLLR